MSKRKENIKMTIFIMVAGIGLIIAGVIGIVTSRIDSREYKNSTDIRKIPAVIVDFSTKDDKDNSGDVRYTTYKFKVSYVIDGKTYKGKYEERVWSRSSSYEKKYTYDQLRKGDTIKNEFYDWQTESFEIYESVSCHSSTFYTAPRRRQLRKALPNVPRTKKRYSRFL